MNLITRDSIFDSMFDDLFEKRWTANLMKADIIEEDENYVIEMDIPGFKKEEIDIKYDEGYITITAKKDLSKKEDKRNFIQRERAYGEYSRSFYLGNVNEDNINAKFEDGILKIKCPKEEKQINSKQISIE
ncbi:MAG: Hsp20/alpha crystallin family protein [Bacilli bacterium]|nr:Hsp20/alpha crystallin family protein [Bacilli bacterium]MDD4831936.1 Hsp20/alpha crystallin family protein [Bacilli bacterium]